METAAPFCKCGCGNVVPWHPKKARWRVYMPGHYRKEEMYKQPEWLLMHYEVLRMTTDEIAAMCGVSGTSILKSMCKHGIKRRDVSASRIGRHAGAKNASWRGGVTPERQRMYKTTEWKTTVSACFLRDDYLCVRCHSAKVGGRKLHAHHVKPWASHPDSRFSLANLVTLCDECHNWVHSKENAEAEYLARLASA